MGPLSVERNDKPSQQVGCISQYQYLLSVRIKLVELEHYTYHEGAIHIPGVTPVVLCWW